MDSLFYKVFHNKYLFNIIVCNAYNDLYKQIKDLSQRSIFNSHTLTNFYYRDYLSICKIGYYSSISIKYYQNNQKAYRKDRSSVYISKELIPTSVTAVYFSNIISNFNVCAIHSNIKTLILEDRSNEASSIVTLPDTIEHLQLDIHAKVIVPNSIKSLIYLNGAIEFDLVDQVITSIQYFEINVDIQLYGLLASFPNLKTLILGSKIKQTFDSSNLPKDLEFLSISSQFGSLPLDLKVLEICNADIKLSESLIPLNVKCIVFRNGYVGELKYNYLPQSLEWLEFWSQKDFKEGFTNSLPKSLKHLHLDDTFNYNLIELKKYGYDLPPSLTSISFGSAFNYDLNFNCLPSNLSSIEFRSDYKLFRLSNFPTSFKIKKSINKQPYNNNNKKQLIKQSNIINRYIKNPISFKSYFKSI